jgi:glycosyltransferase involved in cell wall biosynthesis
MFTLRVDHCSRTETRRELRLAADDFVILQIASLQPGKDHPTALRTMEHLARHDRSVRLVIVGDGPEHDRIACLIEQCGLTENVRLLGVRTDIGRLMAAADALLVTSIAESMPLMVIEAMASELPVVATELGSLRDIVEDGLTGLLAPVGDDAMLANHLLRLMDDEALRKRIRYLAKERAAALLADQQIRAEYLALYDRIAQFRPTGGGLKSPPVAPSLD